MSAAAIDDCASGPCQNGGSCNRWQHSYTCDCTGTDHTGPDCQTREYSPFPTVPCHLALLYPKQASVISLLSIQISIPNTSFPYPLVTLNQHSSVWTNCCLLIPHSWPCHFRLLLDDCASGPCQMEAACTDGILYTCD